MGKIGLIAGREFNERVRKKSFIITTILMPIFFVAMMFVPLMMMKLGGNQIRNIEVVDKSGLIAQHLKSEGVLNFHISDAGVDQLRQEHPEGTFGVLEIGEDIMNNPRALYLYTFESSTLTVESAIVSQINNIIEAERLKGYNIENLAQIMSEVKSDVSLQAKEITDGGETRDSSSALSYIMAFIFGIVIYMFILMYGNMVMLGVIEEKSTKVLELMVSSVKPFQLMMGKIIGIASVAITQLAIWVVFIAVVGTALMNFVAGDMVEAAAAMQSSGMADGMDVVGGAEQAALINRITDMGYILKIFGGFLIYFIGGYLLYAAMFAAVGSAVDNEKDSQNLQLPITIPLILAFVVMLSVVQDPNSPLAFWCSMIPFTSPIIMMARLPYGIPMWEFWLSVAILYASFIAIVWLAGKIYRVGIFMYGKKPTLGELIKWTRYRS